MVDVEVVAMSQDSPLLNLAAELRNHIYRYTVVSAAHINIKHEQHGGIPPALLATCRQVREEVTSIFYSENTFILAFSEPCVARWLRVTGRDRCQMIKTVRIPYGTSLYCQRASLVPLSRVREYLWTKFQVKAIEYVAALTRAGVGLSAIRFPKPEHEKRMADQVEILFSEAGECAVRALVAEPEPV